MTILQTTCILSLAASVVHGFAALSALQQEAGNHILAQLANAAGGTLLDMKLDVGSNEQFHMSLQGLVLELSSEAAVDELRPMLPGADGPNTGVSSAGAKTIVIKDEAYFVGMSGKQHVPLNHGCWELVWRENAGAGVIVCGFLLEHDVKRNDASLEKGRVYMSFPVWTTEGLKGQQEYRRMVEAKAKKHTEDRLDAFKKMDETNNVLKKALHFRNAAEADQKLSFVKTASVAMIPLVGDVMALGTDMMIITKGTVWTKEESSSLFGGRNIQHTLLGTVTIRPGVAVSEKFLKP